MLNLRKAGTLIGAAATLTLTAAIPSHAQNLILNAGFENPLLASNQQLLTVLAGQTTLTNWTVGGHSIDLINTYWTPHSGRQSIDLSGTISPSSGNAAGSISQVVTLQAGKKYALDFWMAGNPGGTKVKSMDILLDGIPTFSNVTFDVTGKTRTNMGWQFRHFEFTPQTSGPVTVTFASNTQSIWGPALDDISLHAMIPEPGTAALLLGAAPLAIFLRRRRSR